MNIFIRLLKALQDARQREADRMIRRYSHLVDEAHEYDRRCAAREADAARRPLGITDLASQAS